MAPPTMAPLTTGPRTLTILATTLLTRALLTQVYSLLLALPRVRMAFSVLCADDATLARTNTTPTSTPTPTPTPTPNQVCTGQFCSLATLFFMLMMKIVCHAGLETPRLAKEGPRPLCNSPV